jgi:hypothetical protein
MIEAVGGVAPDVQIVAQKTMAGYPMFSSRIPRVSSLAWSLIRVIRCSAC